MKIAIGLIAGASALCLAASAFAAAPTPITPGDGVFAVSWHKSKHRAAAVAAYKTAWTAPSKSLSHGICVSRDNNTDFMVFSAFANFEDNFTSERTALSADNLALREPQYSASYKPLMPVGDTNGKTVHQFFRFSVPFKNTEAFIQAASRANSAVSTETKGAFLGVFMPAAGGGTNEANVLHVRIVYPDNKSLGMSIDNYFKGTKGAAGFNEMWALSTGIVSNSIEDCEQFPTAKN